MKKCTFLQRLKLFAIFLLVAICLPATVYSQTPSFTASTNVACTPENVEFTNTSSNTGDDYKWKFGNSNYSDNTGFAPSPVSANYAEPGVYTVWLINETVNDSSSQDIYVYPNPNPVLGDPLIGCELLSGSLTVDVTPVVVDPFTIGSGATQSSVGGITGGEPDSVVWDFLGDLPTVGQKLAPGATDATLNLSDVPVGVYDLLFTVFDNHGCQKTTFQQNVIVVYAVPTASYTYSKDDDCGVGSTTFTGATDADPIGTTYSWEINGSEESTALSFTHNFTAVGDYTVKFTVTNVNGCSSSQSQIISFNTNNTADFSFSGTCVGQATSFTDASTLASDVVGWEWDFDNNGTVDNTTQNPSHTFSSAGSKTVKLAVTFDDGCVREITKNITITGATASFNYDADGSCAPDYPVDFTSTSSVSGSATITAWAWDFDDDGSTDSNLENPSYDFNNFGTFPVALTLTTSDGCSNADTSNVVVSESKVDFAVTPDNGCASLTSSFVVVSDNTSDPIVSYIWAFGDGDSAFVAAPNHTFDVAGEYTTILTAETNSGCVLTTQKEILVGSVELIDTIIVVPSSDSCLSSAYSFKAAISPLFDSIVWNFSDGSAEEYQTLSSQDTSYITHTFTSPDPNYSVSAQGFYNGCPSPIYTVNNIVVNYPSADFSVTSNSACSVPATVDFTNSSTINPSGATGYLWIFDDPTSGASDTSFLENPSHIYNNTGDYTVHLTVTDSATGCTSEFSEVIYVTTSSVDFVADNTTQCAGILGPVDFTSTVTSSANYSAASYSWDFGDGNTSNAANPTHSYSLPNEYDVELIVTEEHGCTDTMTKLVYMDIEGPIVSFTADASNICVNATVNFTNTSTKAGNDSATPALDSFAWDFGDGSAISNLENPSHAYTAAGTYTVTLTVYDENGCEASNSATGSVAVPNLSAGISADTAVCIGENITFTDNSSGTVTEYAWDLDNDGSFDDGTATSASTSFSTTGIHTVSLRIRNSLGCEDISTKDVLVVDGNGEFTVNPSVIGCAPAMVNFTSTDNPAVVASYSWTFGDGDTSTDDDPGHFYRMPGQYIVTLEETLIGGCTRTSDDTITVAGAYGEFSYTNTPGCIDHPEEYYAIEMTSTDELTWDFGDGITLVESVSVGTDSMSTQHTYTTWGTRLPILILRDSTCGDYAYYYGKDNRINTSEPPIAGIDVVSVDDTACVAEIVSFVDTSSIVDTRYQLANWQWDFEDDGTFDSYVQNPTFAFPDSGLYTVRLRVKTEFVNVPGPLNPALDDGCWEEITKEVYVKPIPTVAVANDDQEICSGDESVDMIISSPNDSLATYVWSWMADPEITSSAPVNGVGDTIPGYTFINNSQEVKTVTYSITPTGSEPTTCDGPVATATLIVNPIPIVSSESELSICNGESVDYTITSEVIGTTFKWVATNDVGTVLGFSSDTTATDSVIGDVLSNAGNADGLVTYVITPIGPAPTYCVGPNFWLEVNVLNCEPMIGVAKQLVSTDYNEDGTAEVLFNIRVQNYGNVFLDSIQIVENLDATFGVDNYEVLGLSATSFDVNTGFDGTIDTVLLNNNGTVNVLSVDASTDINLRVKILTPGSYTNKVTAFSTTGDVQDDSQDGSDPDPDGDKNPTNNDELTPIVIGSCTLSANVTQNSTCGNAEGIVQLSTGNAGDEITLNGVVRVSPATYTNLQAGHYKARSISATTGCIAVANFEITNSNSDLSASVTEHMDVTCFGGDDGEIEITAYGGTSPYDYTLIDSMQSVETNQTGSFSSLKMGEYSVKVEDNNGCTYVVSFDIDEPTALFAEIVNSSDVSCNGGNNGKAMVNVTGGTAPYTYSWNDASSQTSALATGLLAASYIVTVTDANNCTTTANVTIDEPASALSISGYTETNPTCFDANNGSIDITVAGGTSPYNFVWSNGQASEDASSLTAGSFSVTVTDVNGCSTSGSYSLTNPTEVSISVGTIVNTNCNASVGSVVLTSSDASTITLNGVTQASGSTFTGLGAGYYVATSNGTCSASTGFNITNSNSDLSGTVSYHKNVSCNGGNDGEATVTFSGGQTPYTFELNGTFETDAIFTNLIAGEYGAKVTDANGCTYTVSFDIDEPTVLVASIVNITDESCGGGSDGTITVTASGGTTPYSYLWSDGQTTGTATGLASGRYDVTITDANGCIALASDSVGIAECQLILVDDNETTPEDMPLFDSVLVNDSDPSGGTLVVTQFVVGNDTTIVPLGGTGSYTILGIGVIEMEPNGVYTFTPEVDYNGDVPEITYTASNGIIEDEATLNITILPLDDLVAEDDNITTPEDSTATGDVTINDIDPNGSPLWVTQFVIDGDTTFVTATTPGVANIPGIGEITIDSLGSYTFVPVPDYSGDVPEITYTVTNGTETDEADINLTILPLNDIPVALADTAVVDEDSPISGDLAINDTISGDGGNIWTIVNQPDSGTVIINNNGTYTYTPDPDFNGVDSFSYMLCDVSGTCDTAVVTVNVNAVNDPPIVEDDNIETSEDTQVVYNIISNDFDIDGNIDQGTIDLDPSTPGIDTIYTVIGEGVYTIDTISGDLTFTPDSNFYGETTPLTYRVCDDGTPLPAECGTADIVIAVIPVNDPPIAGIDTLPGQLNPGGTNAILVRANRFSGTDIDGTIAFVRIESMPDSVTSITVDGITYTSIPVGGIDVATTPDGQPLFDIEVDPVDGVAEVMLEYLVVDNEGAVSVTSGNVIIPFSGLSIVGTVFSDDDGLIDNTVDGTGTNGGGDLFINLVNDLNQVVASVLIQADGTYEITEADGLTLNSEFNLILSDGIQTIGSTLSEATYPIGLTSTGENIGAGAGNDGSVDGILSISTNSGSLADANFGITGAMGVDAGDDAQICSSEGSYTLSTAIANNYTSLHWATNGTGSFDDASVLNAIYTPSEADIRTGEVQLTLTAYGNGTVTTMEDMMVLTLWPQAEVFAGPDASICWGESFIITGSTASNFAQLAWTSSDAGGVFDNVNSLHPKYTPSVSGAAVLTLTASGLGNCSDSITTMTLSVAEEIVLETPDVTDANCDSNEDGFVQLGVTSGGVGTITYTLSIGESNQTGLFENLAAGGYIYTVTDANGCSVSSSFNVDDPNELELTVIEETDNLCFNAENGQARVVAQGGTLPYTFDWGGVVSTVVDDSVSYAENLPAGIYVVTVTDGQGCKEIETLEVEQPDSLNIWMVDLIEPNCDASGEVIVTGTGGVAPYVYTASAGVVSGNRITGLTSGVVTVTITDANGCTNQMDITLTDDDITPPAYTCATTVSQSVDAGNCTAVITLIPPVAFDNCNGTNIIMQYRVIEPNNSISGIIDTANTTSYEFMVGISRVEWSMTDQSGNSSECVQLVEVQEDEDPVIICAGNATFNNSPDECGYVVSDNSLDAIATDNCGVESLTHNYGAWGNPTSLKGAIFPVGTTEVVWIAEDGAGNADTCTTIITVNDVQVPEFVNCPDGDTLTIALFSSACEGTAIWSIPIASDNCSGVEVEQTAGPERGTPISTGFYDVVYTATDTSGNENTCTFTIEVIDTDDPIAVCPPDFYKDNDEGVCSWTAPAASISPLLVTSNCPYQVVYEVSGVTTANGIDDASGTTFNLGTSIVTYTINDTVNDQTWTCDFQVIVSDKEAPVVTCPDPLIEENDPGLCGDTIELVLPTFTENCNVNAVSISYRVFEPDNSIKGPFNASNNLFEFKIGVSQVEWFVSDEAGNVSTCMQEVTIFETEDPVISCPATSEFIFDADPALCGIVIANTDLDATATENCGEYTMSHDYGNWALQNTLEGAFFPVGTTEVTWTATDISGNSSSCLITITVRDREKPEFVNCPTNTTFTVGLFADACESGSIWSIPVAHDNCSEVSVTQIEGPAQGSLLTVGLYNITYRATDEAGNSTMCSFSINVVDTEDPVIVCQPNLVVDNDKGQCSWVSPESSLTPMLSNSNCPSEITWSVEGPDGTSSVGKDDVSGFEFDLGTSTVSYNIVELASGQEWECSFTVTVEDNEAPVIECQPTLEIVADAGKCSSVVDLIVPMSSDNCTTDLDSYFRVFGPDNSTGDLIHADNSTFEFQNGISRVEWTVVDAAGNETKCWQNVWVSPDVDALTPNAGENSSICETDGSFITAASAPDYSSIMWTTSGTGSFADPTQVNTTYVPSENDIDDGFVVLTITSFTECASTSDQMLLRITYPPLVSAGDDATICENTDYQLHGTLINNALAVSWSTLGSGTFSNQSVYNPIYTPSQSDIEAGKAELVFRGISGSTCSDELDTMTLFIDRLPVVDAGDDAWICEAETFELSNASLQYGGQVEWLTNGSGTFDDKTTVNPVYNPSSADVMNGSVTLTISVTPNGVCDIVSDELTLKFSKAPSVEAGENRSTCYSQEIQITGASASNYETLIWTTTGAGTILNPEMITPVYVPAEEEVGAVTMIMTITAQQGCGAVELSDSMSVEIHLPMFVDIGEDETIFMNTAADLSADVVNGSGSYYYVWEPSGSVLDPNSNYTETVDLVGTTIFNVTVTDVKTGCSTSASKIVSIESEAEGIVGFYRGFSPNRDGVNDTWTIKGIEKFPDNKVMIFNRWGDKVRQIVNYNNTTAVWDGDNDNGKELPDGTYYYIVILENLDEFTGWVQLRTDR